MTRRLAPYTVAVGGAVAVTAAIGLLGAVTSVSGLSSFCLVNEPGVGYRLLLGVAPVEDVSG
jgi:hypothetical protein